MTGRFLVAPAASAMFGVPPPLADHARGFRRWTIVSETTDGAVHTGFVISELEPDGSIDPHVHSYEETLYILAGELVLTTDQGAFLLREGDYGLIPIGVPHALRGVGGAPARFAAMSAPQPRARFAGDTFWLADRFGDADPGAAPESIDVRDPRTRRFGHIDPANMDPAKQTQDLLQVSASMRTALLVYSGITVKMMIDGDLGARLQTMFIVQYEPNGVAGPHDHPFEETYLILDGEVDATFDGETHRLRAGDVAWAGAGCVHGFSNPAATPVRWLETQAPQPPSRYSYRFARDWEYLSAAVATKAKPEPAAGTGEG